MTKKISYFACEICATSYLEEERAVMCESVCEKFTPINNVLETEYAKHHRSIISRFIKFIDTYCMHNNISKNPFTIEATKLGALIDYNEDLNEEIKDVVLLDHIYDLISKGTIYKTARGLEVSTEFLRILLKTFNKIFTPPSTKLSQESIDIMKEYLEECLPISQEIISESLQSILDKSV